MTRLVVNTILITLLVSCSFGQLVIQNSTLTAPRTGISSAVLDDSVYFIGGFNNNQYLATSTIEVLDLINGTWSTMTLSSPRGFVTPIVLDPNLYLFGGYDWVNIPYIYSTLERDFIPITNTSGPTVRNLDQIAVFNSTLVAIGDGSIDFLDINTKIWSHNESLVQLMNQYPDTDVIVAENVIILIAPNQTTSAWTYHVLTGQLSRHDNVTFNFTGKMLRNENSNGVVFIIFTEKCLAYNVERNEWRGFSESLIYTTAHVGNFTYVYGQKIGVQFYNWNSEYYGYFGISVTNIFTLGHRFCYYSYSKTFAGIYANSIGEVQISVPFVPLSNALLATGVALNDVEYIFVDITAVYLFSLQYQNITLLFNFTSNVEQILALENNLVAIFWSNQMIVYNAPQQNYVTFLSVDFIPTYRVGNQLLTLLQSFLDTDPSSVSRKFTPDFSADHLISQSGDSLVVMMVSAKPTYYTSIDIYNYRTNQWTINVTDTSVLFLASFGSTHPIIFQYFAAALINDEVFLWNQNLFSRYSLTSNTFDSITPTSTNVNPVFGDGSIFTLEPVIDKSIYFYGGSNDYLYQVDSQTLTQTTTAAISASDGTGQSQSILTQRVEYNSKIYTLRYSTALLVYDAIYYYDPAATHWDSTLLPLAVPQAAMCLVEDLIVIFTANSTLFFYYVPTGDWGTTDFPFNFIPSVASVNGSKVIIGGGIDPLTNTFNDQVIVLNTSSLISLVHLKTPSTNQTAPSSDQLTSDSPIIAAIVVPIVAVVAAGIALLIVLIRRHDKKKRNGVSMVGLEAKYGQWFIPFNNIQFGQQLGQGANGQVFEGRWNNTQVALKVSMTQANTSVISELSLMINMRPHPNIVQLLGFSVHPETDSIILTLEYCNGGSLDTVLFDDKNRDSLTMERKVSWIKGIARGINHLHSNNLVHRDLAARNVLLHNDEAKVTDFGMSRLIDEQQQRGTTKSELGPIRWMAPEALKSKEYSIKSDVWSFGIVIYEILTQQEPHVKEDPITIGRLIRDEGKTPEIPPTCPPALATLMQHCWKMSPNERPSFDKLLQLLDVL